MKIRTVLALLGTAFSGTVGADSIRPNTPVVSAGHDGTCYVKSVPADVVGDKGTTALYKVSAKADGKAATFGWYSTAVHIACNVWRDGSYQTTVVRQGTQLRGAKASRADLALEFYVAGRLVKRYSTLDIAGAPGNVGRSVSHYQIFSSVDGIKWTEDGELVFRATRVDGTPMRFDLKTGNLIRGSGQ